MRAYAPYWRIRTHAWISGCCLYIDTDTGKSARRSQWYIHLFHCVLDDGVILKRYISIKWWQWRMPIQPVMTGIYKGYSQNRRIQVPCLIQGKYQRTEMIWIPAVQILCLPRAVYMDNNTAARLIQANMQAIAFYIGYRTARKLSLGGVWESGEKDGGIWRLQAGGLTERIQHLQGKTGGCLIDCTAFSYSV